LNNDYIVISDLGSGLNYKKRGLKKLLILILKGQVSKIILTHKDRLLRFGSELIFSICQYFDIEIILIENEPRKELSDEEKLAYDVLEILTVFSARLYGRRSIETRRRKQAGLV
jgi:predicted site-specific integrase-resolvase